VRLREDSLSVGEVEQVEVITGEVVEVVE